ncbi:MAG: hypothetical protein ABIT83_08145 [Massilia sp.]
MTDPFARRRPAMLALVLAVHAGLCLLWMLSDRSPRATDATPRGELKMTILMLLPAQRPKTAPVAPIAVAKLPRTRAAASSAPATLARPAEVAPLPSIPPADTAVATSPTAEAKQPAADTAELMARAKAMAGGVDRQLRAGAPLGGGLNPKLYPGLPPITADQIEKSAHTRIERAFASAFIDRSQTLIMDDYTGAEGAHITRITRGGKSVCYTSGVDNFVPGVLHDSSRPAAVRCPPPGPGWSRM